MTKTIALVTPWYGLDLPGGAESQTRGTAEHLAHGGVPVEVLTTCVRDFRSDWSHNAHDAGEVTLNGVTVRRFPANSRDANIFDALNLRLMHDECISPEEERLFIRHNITSAALNHYITTHQGDYTFIFVPYLFGTTYEGVALSAGRAWMIPCFHDESYARLSVTRLMVGQCERLLLNSPGELSLARRLFPQQASHMFLVGEGVEAGEPGSSAAFRRRYGLADGPLLLYAGRADHGKRVDLLVEYFQRYHSGHPEATLVLIGSSDFPAQGAIGPGIRPLGYVPVKDKQDAFAAADVLVQPSERESFSLALMEGWLASTPALVNARCEVTRGFCEASNGGLYFHNYPEFECALELLLANSDLRLKLGTNGRSYVLTNFTWPVVTQRIKRLISEGQPCASVS
jgi:glycosyltransferase involved in cell wall biosynthesis